MSEYEHDIGLKTKDELWTLIMEKSLHSKTIQQGLVIQDISGLDREYTLMAMVLALSGELDFVNSLLVEYAKRYGHMVAPARRES